MNDMFPPPPGRLLVIHAGTHKTATSYIQSRIRLNIQELAQCDVLVRYPAGQAQKHKSLAAAMKAGRWKRWSQYLDDLPMQGSQFLLSAEQFTQPLASPRILKKLLKLAAARGLRLRLVFFLRDQCDYMNSRFVHSTRRLYHHLRFERYVAKQLADSANIFDYRYLFADILACKDVETCFLPFNFALGDPFERLMASQGWSSPQEWKPADPSMGNIQPGCKGVWLAQEVSRRLEQRGLQPRQVRNSSAAIRRIAEREGWTKDRYYGFDVGLQTRVVEHYAAANDTFAHQVWGKSWRDVFPLKTPTKAVYQLPDSGKEHDCMMKFADEVMRGLALNKAKPE